jgi:uncharacterized protein (DUF58 family)
MDSSWMQNREHHHEDDPQGAELRALLKRVRMVELRTRKAVNAHAMGAYHSRFKGRGMAFDESRLYTAGDDPRHVDWNVTARTGELHVKQFVEERELTLLLAVDLSGSLSFGSRAQVKRQLAAEAAALLAFSALRNNDKVGLLLFTDRTERLIRPRKGRSHVLRILREILAARPEGRGTDLASALHTVTHLSRQRAIVALISDLFDSRSEGDDAGAERVLAPLEKPLKGLARRHDLMLLEVTDPLEEELPDVGLLMVKDPETGREVLVDTRRRAARDLYARRMRSEREKVRGRVRRLGVEQLTLRCGRDAGPALVRFLQRRARRAL